MKNRILTGEYLLRLCLLTALFGLLTTIVVAQKTADKVSTARTMIDSTVGGDFTAAVKILDEAIQDEPNRADAYATRSRAYYLWGKKDLAMQDADRALSFNPNETVALNTRGIIKRERKDYEGALADLSAAVFADPPHAFKPLFNRAVVYIIQQKNDLAAADLNKALSLAKITDKPLVYKKRAGLYEAAGKFDAAIADLSQAIQINPKDVDLYGSRGNDYLNSYRFDLAIADYRKNLELEPNNQGVKLNLAMAQARRKYLEPGTKIDSAASDAAFKAGNAAYSAKDYSGAVKYFTECLRATPIADACYFKRADSYRNLEKYDEAIADYTITAELNPNNAVAFGNRGLAYFRKKDFQTAIKDYDRAIALTQTEAYYYLNRGAAYANLGRPADGEADIKKALAMSPNDQSIKDAFENVESQLHPPTQRVIDGGADTEDLATGEEYSERGAKQFADKQYEKAVASFSGCIRLQPANYSCYYNRSVVYDNWGKTAEALADVNKTLEIEPAYAPGRDAKPKLEKLLAQKSSMETVRAEYQKYLDEYNRASDLDAAQNNAMIAEYKKNTGAYLDKEHPSSIAAAQKTMVCGYLVKMKPLEEQASKMMDNLKQLKSSGKLDNNPNLLYSFKLLEENEAYDPHLVFFLYEPLGCH